MNEREALKLALEALELHLAHHEHGCVYLDPALAAIKEALAQPEQEPVAWKEEEIIKVYEDMLGVASAKGRAILRKAQEK